MNHSTQQVKEYTRPGAFAHDASFSSPFQTHFPFFMVPNGLFPTPGQGQSESLRLNVTFESNGLNIITVVSRLAPIGRVTSRP